MSVIDYYDPDSVIKANHTPGLEPVNPKYTAEDTPPPLVLEDTSSSSAASNRSGRHSRPTGKRRSGRGRTRASQCDAVLIGQIDPNRPDIARIAGEIALASASQSEAEDEGGSEEEEEEDEGDFDEEPMIDPRHGEVVAYSTPAAETNREMVMKASEALKLHVQEVPDADVEMRDRSETPQEDDEQLSDRPERYLQDSRPSTAGAELASPKVVLDVRPPPRPPAITTTLSPRNGSRGDEEDPAVSPILARFITRGDPGDALPAMQTSPPRSSAVHSPEATGQTLPSLKTALSQMSDTSSNGMPFHSATGAPSPSMTRPSPGQHIPGFGPSPASYSHPSPSTNGMSPPGMPTHRSGNYWPPPPLREGSQSTATPSEYTSNHSQSTPSSAITVPSPANSYPASITAHQRQDSEGTPLANGNSPTTNGAGPLATSTFKCTFSGCTAPPFQTQYLLNSHANVHSSSRPHFCPVSGCNRGPGGKGFKRKNEMIR